MSKFIRSLLVSLIAMIGSFAVYAQDVDNSQSNDNDDGAIQLDADDASEIGSIAFDRAIADLPLITRGEDFDRIQSIMKRLVRSAARPDVGWRMVLVDSDIPDAWVMPDGKMAIYRGILDRLQDDQEVAALLTHQMAHSLLGHNMFLLGRGEIQSVLMAQDTGARGSESERLAYNLGVSIAEGVQVMPYSRMMESEADDLAMVMMLKAGYDPAAAIGTWQWLSDENRFAMEYLSAHPSVSWRIEQMSEQLPCYHKAFKETWGHYPVGLEEQSRDSTIECPPFVTGLMSNIKRDHREENYIYDWDDEPGYEAAYYDHVRYQTYFYDDPYYNAWYLGRVNYSFGFRFGGFSYYRWSPYWSGWGYYDPWRPVYVFRIGRGHHHYVDDPYRRPHRWSRQSVTFRDRHYDRHDYTRDEDRYRERRKDYKEYSRSQRNIGSDVKRREDRTLRSNKAEIRQQNTAPISGGVRPQNEAGKRAITSDRTNEARTDRARRQESLDLAKPQVQPKRDKDFRTTSKNADIKASRNNYKSNDRQGVMEFRDETQKQPIRNESGKKGSNKTYSNSRERAQPKVEQVHEQYKSRQVRDAPKQERGQQQESQEQSYQAPRQSQPQKQNYKAPKQAKPNSSKSSDNFIKKSEPKSYRSNSKRDRNR